MPRPATGLKTLPGSGPPPASACVPLAYMRVNLVSDRTPVSHRGGWSSWQVEGSIRRGSIDRGGCEYPAIFRPRFFRHICVGGLESLALGSQIVPWDKMCHTEQGFRPLGVAFGGVSRTLEVHCKLLGKDSPGDAPCPSHSSDSSSSAVHAALSKLEIQPCRCVSTGSDLAVYTLMHRPAVDMGAPLPPTPLLTTPP